MLASKAVVFVLVFTVCLVCCQDYPQFPCSVPNDCTFTDSGYSFCRDGKCRQCDPDLNFKDCQCPLNQYCISDRNNTNWGYCADKFSDNILGNPCNRDLSENLHLVKEGINDQMYCGKLVFFSNDTEPLVEWKGVCIKGECMQCSSVPIPSIPFAHCEDGRSCRYDGVYVIAPSGMLSWSYFWYQPMEIVFFFTLGLFTLAVITLIILLAFTVWNTRRKLKKE